MFYYSFFIKFKAKKPYTQCIWLNILKIKPSKSISYFQYNLVNL